MRSKYQLYLLIIGTLLIFCVQTNAFEKSTYQNNKLQNISYLYTLADSLLEINNLDSARQICQQNLDTIISKYSNNSQEAVLGMYKLALCEFAIGNYHDADDLLAQAILLQSKFDSTSLMAGRLWYKKSEVGNQLCDCKEIIPIAEKAVTLLENNLGKNHSEVAHALEVLGYVLAHDYKYEESLIVLHRSLMILEQKYGKESSQLSKSLVYLSRISLIYYKSEDGIPYIERAIRNIQGTDSESLKRLSEVYLFKAYLYYVMSDYEAAQETSIKSIALATEVYGEFHPKIAELSSILSRIYLQLGKYELAEPLMLHIKKVYEKTYNSQDPVMYYSYVNLGELYISQGRYDEAEYYFTQFLNLPNIKESFRIGNLENLAQIYFQLGKIEKAKNICNGVLEFRTNQLGKNHPTVALSLKLLAKIQSKQNDFDSARKTYFRILEIFRNYYGENSLYTASTYSDLAQLYTDYNMPAKAEEYLAKTIAIRSKELLSNHPLVANSYLDIAESQLMQNKINQSFNNMLKGLKDRREFIDRVFRYASSEQKLLYIKDHPLIYDPLLILAVKNKSDKTIRAASEMVLRGKGLVIDALSEDKYITACEDDFEISVLVKKYTDICTRIAAMAIATKSSVINTKEIEILEILYKTRDSYEAELSKNCATFNDFDKLDDITLEKISSMLPANTLFIDYVKFHPTIGDPRSNYLAYVLSPNGEISLLDLGDAESIDRLVFEAREKIQESRFQIYSTQSKQLEDDFKILSHALYQKIVDPFEKQLKGVQKIFIAPDSDLNLIPFEIFVDNNNSYLIETVEISYLSSGRDLIPQSNEFSEPYGLIVEAAPDFNYKNSSQKFIKTNHVQPKYNSEIPPARSSGNCLENAFSPLSYSREEGEHLIKLFKKKYSNEYAKLYYNADATTTVLSELKKPPRFVHLSTHGFFCQDNDNLYLKNPLLRSGLAFTGANFTISGEVETPFTYDDGLLTALEVTGLNLVGTELVTLSACETGIGETVNGEGVFGLRRAFQIAGAKSILMSMWKISDKGTADLMRRFYDKLFSGSSKQKALRDSALEILKKSREEHGHGHPYLWGGFILTGNPN